MDTLQELNRLQRELARALHETDRAEAHAQSAKNDYDKAFAEWEKANTPLVRAKESADIAKFAARQRVTELREEARSLMLDKFIDNLPDGFNQKRDKVVVFDPQSFLQVARDSFPFLLKLDEKAVDKFFKAMAEEQSDGAFILPENIRRWAQVEVITKPLPNISDAKLSKMVFENESENLSKVTEVVTIPVVEAWEPPQNAIALLTAPTKDPLSDTPSKAFREFGTTKELPAIEEDYSSQGESIPFGAAFNEDRTWNNKPLWDAGDTETLNKTVQLEPALVPPTNEIFT